MEKISCGGFYIGDNLEIVKDEFGRPILNATGGGGGGSRFVVTVSMDFQTGDMTADKSFNEILTAIESNKNVMAKFMVTLGQESQLLGMYPFVAYEMPGLFAFGYYYQGDIDGFALSVEHNSDTGKDRWDSSIVPHPDD